VRTKNPVSSPHPDTYGITPYGCYCKVDVEIARVHRMTRPNDFSAKFRQTHAGVQGAIRI
jgi:hypothetical protein